MTPNLRRKGAQWLQTRNTSEQSGTHDPACAARFGTPAFMWTSVFWPLVCGRFSSWPLVASLFRGSGSFACCLIGGVICLGVLFALRRSCGAGCL